jgi:hypothetical protein
MSIKSMFFYTHSQQIIGRKRELENYLTGLYNHNCKHLNFYFSLVINVVYPELSAFCSLFSVQTTNHYSLFTINTISSP